MMNAAKLLGKVCRGIEDVSSNNSYKREGIRKGALREANKYKQRRKSTQAILVV